MVLLFFSKKEFDFVLLEGLVHAAASAGVYTGVPDQSDRSYTNTGYTTGQTGSVASISRPVTRPVRPAGQKLNSR